MPTTIVRKEVDPAQVLGPTVPVCPGASPDSGPRSREGRSCPGLASRRLLLTSLLLTARRASARSNPYGKRVDQSSRDSLGRRSDASIHGPTNRRSYTPVRVVIHSSVVSMMWARSWLETTFLGMAIPVPTMAGVIDSWFQSETESPRQSDLPGQSREPRDLLRSLVSDRQYGG